MTAAVALIALGLIACAAGLVVLWLLIRSVRDDLRVHLLRHDMGLYPVRDVAPDTPPKDRP